MLPEQLRHGRNHTTLPVQDHQPPLSPWFSCNANNNNIELDPLTDHLPSPMETVHHKFLPGGYSEISSKVKRAHEIIQMRLHQRLLEGNDAKKHHDPRYLQRQQEQQQHHMQAQQHSPAEQYQPRPNYSIMIESKHSRDDDTAPFDEHSLDEPHIELNTNLGIDEMNLEDTFGFAKNLSLIHI